MAKKKAVKKEKKKIDNKKIDKKKYIKIFIIAIISLLVLAGLALLGSNLIRYFANKKYKPYEDKMDKYALSSFYNNSKAKSSEDVTTSEAISIIISALLNTSDISMYVDGRIYDDFNNETWTVYAKEMGIIENSLTTETAKEKIKYIDVLVYLSRAEQILNHYTLNTDVAVNLKDFNKYNQEQQYAIKDAISYGIIPNENVNLSGNKNMTKGMLNKLVVDYIEKKNLVLFTGEKVRTTEENMPSNKDEYPYILETVENVVYEIPIYSFLDNSANAIETYASRRSQYDVMNNIITEYYNILLNIDYETITFEDFKSKISSVATFSLEDEDIQKYVNYVKENKIKITGTSKVQFPIIYSDGIGYRVRTKIDYNVSSQGSLKNVLFLDFNYNKENEYILGSNTMIIDTPIVVNRAISVNVKPIAKSIAGKVEDIYSTVEPSLDYSP